MVRSSGSRRCCESGLEPTKPNAQARTFARLPSRATTSGMFSGRLKGFVPVLLFSVCAATAEPIEPSAIEVIDGDIIRANGRTIRLIGFDAPETGSHARCESERTLAAKATFRLRQLVSAGGLDLRLVPCACRPGTEGTPHCNYGRACGVLTAAGKEVGVLRISEGLARSYVCGRTSCPTRKPWCESMNGPSQSSAHAAVTYLPSNERINRHGSKPIAAATSRNSITSSRRSPPPSYFAT